MATRKRSVEIEVVADTKRAAKSLGNIEKKVGKTGKAFSNFAKVAASAFAFRQLVSGVGDAIDRAERMNSAYAITSQVIEQTGQIANVTADDIKELAREQSLLTGVDKALIVESSNVLLTFKNLRNEVGLGNDVFDRAAKLVLDVSAVMGTDAKSGALQLGKALNDPVSQMGALSRAGLTFSESQKQMIKDMVRAGDLVGAQTLILGELESQLGGTAAASADTTDKIANAWKEVQEQIGGELLTILDQNLDGIIEKMLDAGDAAVGMANDVAFWAGAISRADKTQTDFNLVFDKTITSAEDMAVAIEDLRQAGTFVGNILHGIGLGALAAKLPVEELDAAFRELLDDTNLSRDQLELLLLLLPDIAKDSFLSTTAVENMSSAIEEQIAKLDEAARLIDLNYVPALREEGEALGALGVDLGFSDEQLAAFAETHGEALEAIQATTTALHNQRLELLSAGDPIFATINAMVNAERAQEAYDEAVKQHTKDSEEARRAQLKLAEANGEVELAFKNLADGDVTKGIQAIARFLKISEADARALLDTMGLLDGLDVEARIRLQIGEGQRLFELNNGGSTSTQTNITVTDPSIALLEELAELARQGIE